MQRISNKLLKILKKQSSITWFAFWKDNSLRSEWIMTIAFLRTSVHTLPAHSRGHLQIMSLCPEDSPHPLPGSSLWPRTFFWFTYMRQATNQCGAGVSTKIPQLPFHPSGTTWRCLETIFPENLQCDWAPFPTAVNYSLTLA